MKNKKLTIGIIGGGNMGGAIIDGIHKQHSIIVCEANEDRIRQLKKQYRLSVKELAPTVKESSVIILAVKPQDFEAVLLLMKPIVKANQLFISIAAGITTSFIEKRLGKRSRVIRVMPNLPVVVKEGVTALSKGKNAKASDIVFAQNLFNTIGKTVVVREQLIDAITATSGSGPAYVFYFIECFEAAARKLGLKDDLAKGLVLQTLLGSLKLIIDKNEDAAVLRQRVTSRGGTTQAALDVLFRNQFQKMFADALKAAKRRAKQLAK